MKTAKPLKNKAKLFDPSLTNVYDAVHGAVDLRDACGEPTFCSLLRLLGTRMMDRLRRIKLLGYASHSYPSADHSRYAHALGSMHLMRSLLAHLQLDLSRRKDLLKDLKQFGRPEINKYESFEQHMLVAALLQDVGELPYGHATSRVLRPADELCEDVSGATGLSTVGWEGKDVFTIASILKEDYCRHDRLNLAFLVYLITGHLQGETTPSLRMIRHLLQGEVDADRLDYVYRDAHHTVGGRGTPQAVIDSLRYYDERGPVFAEPGPVSEFLATRASLWTTVYFSAVNRFRTLLLITLLRDVLKKDELAEAFFRDKCTGPLSFDAFQELDDISLHTLIRDFSSSKAHRRLGPRARNALDILLGGGPEYEYFWLPPGRADGSSRSRLTIPADLFFDSCADHEVSHSVFEPGSIRVHAPRFRYLAKETLSLEECCGAFSEIFKQPWSALERQGSILIFRPKDANGAHWTRVLNGLSERSLLHALEEIDPLSPLDCPSDTRKEPGFDGPDLFVSFCWADIRIVRKVVAELYRLRRHYFLLLHDFDGIGGTPGDNSSESVKKSGSVLMVVSAKYIHRFHEKANGNIAKELYTIRDRMRDDDLPVTYLTVDPTGELADFPYTLLGLSELPFVGTVPLRDAQDEKIREAVGAALKSLELKATHA